MLVDSDKIFRISTCWTHNKLIRFGAPRPGNGKFWVKSLATLPTQVKVKKTQIFTHLLYLWSNCFCLSYKIW